MSNAATRCFAVHDLSRMMNSLAALGTDFLRVNLPRTLSCVCTVIQPFPNWYVIGPNIQYFHQHGVRGLFEEGDDVGKGSDMEELKVRPPGGQIGAAHCQRGRRAGRQRGSGAAAGRIDVCLLRDLNCACTASDYR